MEEEDQALKFYEQASELEDSQPQKSISLLKELVRKFPNTFTTENYAVDAIVRIAYVNEWWDEGIKACELAQTIKSYYAESYRLEAEAFRLKKDGKLSEALEVLLKKDTLNGEWFATLRDYGNSFAHIGNSERAWSLYEKAVALALKERISPHSVREAMARMLSQQGEKEEAIVQIIIGISEAERFAKKGAPKYLVNSLKQMLRSVDIKDTQVLDEIVKACKANDGNKAIELFQSALKTSHQN